MIPWRSGKKGNWSLNDCLEEIYLDRYVLEQVAATPSDAAHLSDITYHWETDGISSKERKNEPWSSFGTTKSARISSTIPLGQGVLNCVSLRLQFRGNITLLLDHLISPSRPKEWKVVSLGGHRL